MENMEVLPVGADPGQIPRAACDDETGKSARSPAVKTCFRRQFETYICHRADIRASGVGVEMSLLQLLGI